MSIEDWKHLLIAMNAMMISDESTMFILSFKMFW